MCEAALVKLASSFVSDISAGLLIDHIPAQPASAQHSARLSMQRVGSCYLELSFGTTGVDTWCYLECYLVLPGVLPGVTWSVTWCDLGVAWLPGFFYVFFCGPKITAFLKLKLFEKIFPT